MKINTRQVLELKEIREIGRLIRPSFWNESIIGFLETGHSIEKGVYKDQKQSRILLAFFIRGFQEKKRCLFQKRTQHLTQELDGIFWENLFRLEVGEVISRIVSKTLVITS